LDILGVVMVLIGLLTVLGLVTPVPSTGIGAWIVLVSRAAGWGSIVLPVSLLLVGVWLVLRNVERLPMLSAERMTGP
jgi:S-DNA-T family DNA segregation ATPase FtsK/SpoIIIE